MRQILTTKFADWRYEDEVRVFVELQDRDAKTGLYHKDFGADISSKEIIVVPKCHFSVSDLKNIHTKYYGEVKAMPSRWAFRTFKAIERKVPLMTKIKKKCA